MTLRTGVAVLAMLLALVPAGCSRSSPAPTSLRVCMFPVQDFLPHFVMQAQGFARARGLEFQETRVAGGAAAIDALAAGTLDLCPAVGSFPILVAAERGVIPDKVVVVAGNDFADREHPAVAVLAARSVRTWHDLRGGQVATNARNSITAAAFVVRLQQEGVADVTLLEMSFANMGLAVAGGNVVAATLYEPFLTQSLLRGDGHLLGWVAGGPPFERLQLTAIVVSRSLHSSRPDAVKAYLRAHLDAVAWMSRQEVDARRILAKRLDLVEEVGRRVQLARWPFDARNDPALLDAMQPALVTAALLKRPIPARPLLDESLLDQVLAERR